MARGGCATQHVRAHLARLPARQRNPADEAATRSGHKQPGPSPLGHPPSTAHPEGLPWGGGGGGRPTAEPGATSRSLSPLSGHSRPPGRRYLSTPRFPDAESEAGRLAKAKRLVNNGATLRAWVCETPGWAPKVGSPVCTQEN